MGGHFLCDDADPIYRRLVYHAGYAAGLDDDAGDAVLLAERPSTGQPNQSMEDPDERGTGSGFFV